MSIYQYWNKLNLSLPEDRSLYVLVESTHKNRLLGILDFYEESYVSLWDVEDRPNLALYAPYLVAVEEGSLFDRWLIENEKTISYTIINSRYDLVKLKAHLKHYTMFDDAHEDRRLFFRIGNSSMFYLYIKSIEDNYQDLGKIFAHGFIESYLFRDQSEDLTLYCDVATKEQIAIQSSDSKSYLLWRDLMTEDENAEQG